MRSIANIIVLLVILILATSCKSKMVYVPIETKEIERQYIDRLHKDSIYLHDSIFVDRWRSNDTVYLTKEKYKYLYRDLVRIDSVSKDSIVYKEIPYPVETIKEVNRIKTWQIILMCLGGVLIGYLGFRIYRFFI